MNLTITVPDSALRLLQKQADQNNAQPNRAVQQTAEDVLREEVQLSALNFLRGLQIKFADADKQDIIAALDDPIQLAKLREALK